MGAWIEIEKIFDDPQLTAVAPSMGAWIEMSCTEIFPLLKMSLPLWERGLK